MGGIRRTPSPPPSSGDPRRDVRQRSPCSFNVQLRKEQMDCFPEPGPPSAPLMNRWRRLPSSWHLPWRVRKTLLRKVPLLSGQGLHTDGHSLLPMTAHSSKGVLDSGLGSGPVRLQEPSMAADQALLEEQRAAVASRK
ncbi:hypothetical protein LEMLEM_LOCUS5777 [Lemmus lemmus]